MAAAGATLRYLLDTNILVHYVRASVVWEQVRDTYQPLTSALQPIISVVTAGELRSLARQWNWGAPKLDRMEFALGFFKVQDILDDATLRMYATIDAYCKVSANRWARTTCGSPRPRPSLARPC